MFSLFGHRTFQITRSRVPGVWSLKHAKLGTFKTSVTQSLLSRRAEYLNKRSKISTYLRLSEMLM